MPLAGRVQDIISVFYGAPVGEEVIVKPALHADARGEYLFLIVRKPFKVAQGADVMAVVIG
jgi:hypothetical protein